MNEQQFIINTISDGPVPLLQTIIYWNLHTINRWKTWKIERLYSVPVHPLFTRILPRHNYFRRKLNFKLLSLKTSLACTCILQMLCVYRKRQGWHGLNMFKNRCLSSLWEIRGSCDTRSEATSEIKPSWFLFLFK